MATDKIVLEIELDEKGVVKSVSGIEAAFANASKGIEKNFDDLGTSIGRGFLLKLAAAGAAIGAALFSKASIDAAAEQEAAFNRFAIALRSTGEFTKSFAEDFNQFASSIQQTTKFQDDAVLSSAALLQQIGRLRQDQLIPASQAAINLASALQLDLETAFTLVGKAAQGNTDSLKRYGIEVQKGKDDAETFANTLKKLNESFGGAAASEVKTFSGSLTLLNNTFGELLETIGNVVIKNPAVIGLIQGLSKALGDFTAGINVEFFSAKLTTIIQVLASFALSVNEFLVRPLTYFYDVAKVVFLGLETLIKGSALIFSTYAQGVASALNVIGVVSDESLNQVKAFRETIGEELTQLASDTATAAQNIGSSATFADQLTTSIDGITNSINEAIAASARFGEEAPTSFGKGTKAMSESSKKATFDINQSLGQGISNTIQQTVKALVQGKNGFEAFAKGVLSTIGDLAIQLGTFFIINGIGLQALEALGPAKAIAAGAALVAFGSLLKAATGGGGDLGVANGAGSTPGTTGAQPGGEPTVNPASATEEPKSNVVINVDGALDSRSVGLQIAQILQDISDTNAAELRFS